MVHNSEQVIAEILDTTKTIVHTICADYNLRFGHVYNVITKALTIAVYLNTVHSNTDG